MRFKLSTLLCLITVLLLVFTLPPPVHSGILEIRVSSGDDDAEQRVSDGDMSRGSNDLELINCPSRGDQKVGIRFRNVQVPQGVTITNAYIEFSCDETGDTSTDLTIYGQDIDNAPYFSSTNYNISNRTTTSASVNWSPVDAWNTVHQSYQSPDISSIVQEIVNRGGWSAGNAMAFIITGSGRRTAEAYNGDTARAPLLHIEFSVPGTYTITASAGNGGSISPSGPVIVNEGASKTFTITPEPGNSVENVLVDGGSVGAVTTYTFSNVTSDHTIVASFTLPPGFCTDASDIPLTTLRRAAPANIMFVLDDSGSMDWEFLTTENDGLFDNEYYVFNDPGDNLYDDNKILDDTQRRRWKSQWSGYNKMYYDPTTDYDPWPTLDNADPDNPRSHPMHETPTFNLGGAYDWVATGVLIDNQDTANFTKTGVWAGAWDSEAYNGDYYYTNQWDQDITATWTPHLPAGSYDVYARWRALDNRCQAVPYTVTHAAGSDTVYVDQRQNGGLWNHLGTFTFNADAGDVSITYYVTDNDQYRVCADAVKFVQTDTTAIDINNAHYYTFDDINVNGEYETGEPVYLVVLDGLIDYYEVNDDDSDDIVDPGELVLTTSPPAGVQSGRTYAQERQNFANWYSFYRRRELTATASVAEVIASMQGVQMGIRSINGNLIQPVLKIKVEGDDESAALLSTLYNLTLQAQFTPLRRGLREVGRYFHQNDGETGGIGESPYASAAEGGACQQAFAIVMTDGYWNGSSPGFGNEDGDNGVPYADSYSDTLADVAMYYYENDLASGLDNLVPTNPDDQAAHQHMSTYTVSFGVSGTLTPDDYDFEAGNYPTWPNPGSGDQQKIDDLWHAAVNGRGTFLSASRPQDLVSSLLSIMQNIESRIGSASSVSVNGDELYEELGQDILMFQASYYSDGWTGDVKAYGIDTTTGQVITTSYQWSSADQLEATNWNTGRIIATYDGSTGIPFRFDSLTGDQKDLLDANWATDDTTARNILNFLRGDTSNEESHGGSFRDRYWRLGDIVHSSPVYNNGVLYAGGNDGMLHAFSASDGSELFAYVPNLVFENLSQLADTDYTHLYYVDLTPTVKEVSSLGKTILVGGLGKGGKGYYALDVSDPSSITTETALAGKVMWEYGADDDLGYSYSKPVIVESNDPDVGGVVIFGNGYNSINDHAVLFILNPSTGSVLKKIDTGVGSCNGLSSPVAIDVDYDEKADYVYAGDLRGNLWKFDLTDSSYLNWGVAYEDGATPKPLFQAKGPGGSSQPITTKPDVMRHCEKDGFTVVFGTGRYLGETDMSDTSIQTIYGIWDYGDSAYDGSAWSVDDNSEYLGSFDRGSTPELSNQPDNVTLLQQTQIDWRVVNDNYLRTLSDNEPNWETVDDLDADQLPNPGSDAVPPHTSHAGWYFDLPISGERVVTDVLIREGKAVVVTYYPQTEPCGSGGYSIVHEMDACSGARLSEPQFDINGDGVIDQGDLINIGTEENPQWVAPTGIQKAGRLQPPAVLRMGNREMKYFSSSSGAIATVMEKAVRLGIVYWIEYPQQ